MHTEYTNTIANFAQNQPIVAIALIGLAVLFIANAVISKFFPSRFY